MQKNTLTQEQINTLDGISIECGFELFMPPLKNQIHPFFVINKRDNSACLIQHLAASKFNYSIINVSKQMYVIIKG